MFLSKYLNIAVFYGNAFDAITAKDVVNHIFPPGSTFNSNCTCE